MTVYKEFNLGTNKNNPLGSFGPLVTFIIFIALLYFVIKGLFWALNILAPFLIIGAALLDHTVITDFVKFLLRLIKENPLIGLVAILLTVVGFPAVAGYLFLKAWARRAINKKVESIKKEKERFDDYEEVKPNQHAKNDEDDFLDLSTIEQKHKEQKTNVENKKDNDYDTLFK